MNYDDEEEERGGEGDIKESKDESKARKEETLFPTKPVLQR